MNPSEVFIFSLNEDEKKECDKKGIPHYYWYILKAKAKGWGSKGIKEFIHERLKKKIEKSIFSDKETWTLATYIVRVINGFEQKYQNGKGRNIQELNKKFNSEINALFKRVEKEKRRRGKEKKSGINVPRKTFNLTSEIDNQELKIILVSPGSSIKKDQYCMYFKECYNFSKRYNALLDCRPCLQQDITN